MDERRVLEKGLLCSGGNTAKGVAHAKEGGGGVRGAHSASLVERT